MFNFFNYAKTIVKILKAKLSTIYPRDGVEVERLPRMGFNPRSRQT